MQASSPANDDDAAYAEGAITLWSNLLTLIGTHLRQNGMPREELLEMIDMLDEANAETIRSARARNSASNHLSAVREVLAQL